MSRYAPDFLQHPRRYPSRVTVKRLRQEYPNPDAELGTRLEALYYSEISFFDDVFARLAGALGIASDDVLFLFTSDHGEELVDHGGLGHGHTLYEELVRVPLFVRWPAAIPAGRKLDAMVSLVDVYPTLLELTGIEVPAGLQGSSLAALLTGAAEDAPREAYFTLPPPRETMLGIRRDEWKLIATPRSEPRLQLYRLDTDPGETTDLSGAEPELAIELARALHLWYKGLPGPPADLSARVLDDETALDQLRALGYID